MKQTRTFFGIVCVGTLLASVGTAFCGDLTVHVTGKKAATGEIACSLFNSASGFPGESAQSVHLWVPAKTDGVTCAYPNLPAGTYAVAVFQDLKGTHHLETNMVGMPTEPTGTSNNVSASFGPPDFKAASFPVDAQGKKTITIAIK